ncbi:MAG: outer membrane beta-barrel protein, partial [Salinivirgaceae bacterium]|nr:outer membrane beta-barrel protein [Salinivirgaceae bacterium]
MKKIALFGLLTFSAMFIFGQDSFSVHFSQTYSKFKFVNSDGVQDETINSEINYSYGVNYSKVFNSGVFLRPELGYKNFGAISSVNNERLEWSLSYLDFNLGIGYIYKEYRIQPYFGISPYFAYLYKADQIIGNTYFDMLASESILKSDYGINE